MSNTQNIGYVTLDVEHVQNAAAYSLIELYDETIERLATRALALYKHDLDRAQAKAVKVRHIRWVGPFIARYFGYDKRVVALEKTLASASAKSPVDVARHFINFQTLDDWMFVRVCMPGEIQASALRDAWNCATAVHKLNSFGKSEISLSLDIVRYLGRPSHDWVASNHVDEHKIAWNFFNE